MNCGGTYKHNRKEYQCGKKWGCRNYTFRCKDQKVVTSKTIDCEHYKPVYHEKLGELPEKNESMQNVPEGKAAI
jgi:hypothetical protein